MVYYVSFKPFQHLLNKADRDNLFKKTANVVLGINLTVLFSGYILLTKV